MQQNIHKDGRTWMTLEMTASNTQSDRSEMYQLKIIFRSMKLKIILSFPTTTNTTMHMIDALMVD